MDLLPTLLTLLIMQALMGAFDTIYHHELTVALPAQPSARIELKIHAVRSVLYGAIFFGLAWFVFGGWWMVLLWAVIATEVVLTLIDFLIEDHTRVLPQSERVLHTLLAIGGGAAFTVLALQTPAWWALPNGLAQADYGWQSWFLTLAALLFGIGAFGLLTRRSALIMFMCVELMLNAVNLTFVTFSNSLNDVAGQASVFFVMVVAAAEVTVGLAIVVAVFRRRQSNTVDDLSELKG